MFNVFRYYRGRVYIQVGRRPIEFINQALCRDCLYNGRKLPDAFIAEVSPDYGVCAKQLKKAV